MKRKIYANICFVSVFIILVTTFLTLIVCYKQFENQVKSDVRNETNLLAHHLNTLTDDKKYLTSASELNSSKRITLISSDGTVVFDNTADILEMKNHNDRPEIISAKADGFGEAVRLSDTLDKNTYYCAVLLKSGYVLRIANTKDSIFSVFINIVPLIILIVFIVLVFSLFFAMKLTNNIIKPINDINLENVNDEKIYVELLPFIKRITEQNKKINSQIEQITAQKNRLDTISENMNEGLIVLDSLSMVLSINNSALKIFDLKESEVIGKSFLYVNRNLELIEYVKSALKGNNGRKTITIKNNTYELFYNPVIKNDAVFGAMLLFFDISEKAKAEKIRREFSANVSHELKTPITTILGYSQIINNGMAKLEDIKSFTLKIEKEANRLITLIDDIINLSKLDEEVFSTEKQSVDLYMTVDSAISNLKSQIEEKNIKVSVGGSKTFVPGNRQMLEELVYNLCENAIKYNKLGGSIDIYVGEGKISVADTGIGIAKENQDRIFERFYRVDSSRSKKINGTGLGLSIVKHIALFHNAKIEVQSQLGKGTKIIVHFKEQIN